MQEPIQDSEAERLALRKMFKAIAEYGREVRLRRRATPDEPQAVHDIKPARRKKHRRKKGST